MIFARAFFATLCSCLLFASLVHAVQPSIVLSNPNGFVWTIAPDSQNEYAFGSLTLNGKEVENPLNSGLFLLRHGPVGDGGKEIWVSADTAKDVTANSVTLTGYCEVDLDKKEKLAKRNSTSIVTESEGKLLGTATFQFEVQISMSTSTPGARITYNWRTNKHMPHWEVVMMFHNASFNNEWMVHVYPHAEADKYLNQRPFNYTGVPSVLYYRDDSKMSVLYGMGIDSDYMNPLTWTGGVGAYFRDQTVPLQYSFFNATREREDNKWYTMPIHILVSDLKSPQEFVPDLVQQWVQLEKYTVEPLTVRTPAEALELFAEGRRKTKSWCDGVGYRLEIGDPESDFVYMGENPLSAYFEYLWYLRTNDSFWRKRSFIQADFTLKAQNLDEEDINYGAMHTAYDIPTKKFNSDDRGANVGYKPDLNVYMARYLLQLHDAVLKHEGVSHDDWRQTAIRALDWARRQTNPDGGLAQKVELRHSDDHYYYKGQRSVSSAAQRALPSLQIAMAFVPERKTSYESFMQSLENYNVNYVEGKLRFNGGHPDLPPDELEESSFYGIIEYWIDKFEKTNDEQYLQRAEADMYTAFLSMCPIQLSWVSNPTQSAASEQTHFLQYSIYAYQNKKVTVLTKLAKYTGSSFWKALADRVTQTLLWTQVTKGDQKGSTHERIADPWLMRSDEYKAYFDSMGSTYIGEQSLDAMLQFVELGY